MPAGEQKPIILLAFADDCDDPRRCLRSLAQEREGLERALHQAVEDGLCQLVVRDNATAGAILDLFQDFRNRIVAFHFGGHAGSYELLFETEEGSEAPVDAAAFAAFLGHQDGLQLVFLNGCSTQAQVQGLLDAGVSVVVATSQAIDDQVAMEFAARFYRGLGTGAPLRVAFGEAQAAVQAARNGRPRTAFGDTVRQEVVADRWPWELHSRPGSAGVLDWNLPEAVGDPLFGLPDLPDMPLPETPYRYLDWFRREDAPVFLGRDREIRALYQQVDPGFFRRDSGVGPGAAQAAAVRSAPLLLFYGQAGVGKSSLLAAGLLPRLEARQAVRYVRRSLEAGLLGTLRQALGADGPADDLGAAWRAAEEKERRPLTVLLDQVEEAYTRPRGAKGPGAAVGAPPGQLDDGRVPHEMAELLDSLKSLFLDAGRRPRGRLVLGFRKEWLAEIEQQVVDRRLEHANFLLERIGRSGILQVVEAPARPGLRPKYRLEIEAELPELIADDLLADQGSAVAPALQIVLSTMWEKATARSGGHPVFDRELYGVLAREGVLLSDFVSKQMRLLRGEYPAAVDSGLALDLLEYHTTALGTAEQRTWADLREAYEHQESVLPGLWQKLKQLYLLVDPAQHQPEAEASSRLAHDTMAPVVRDLWARSEAPGQVARRILENRSAEWRATGGGALMDAWALQRVEEGRSGMRRLTETEQELLDASCKKLAGDLPPPLSEEIFPPQLKVTRFVPGRALDLDRSISARQAVGSAALLLLLGLGYIGLSLLTLLVFGPEYGQLMVFALLLPTFSLARGQIHLIKSARRVAFDLAARQIVLGAGFWLGQGEEKLPKGSTIVGLRVSRRRNLYSGALVIRDIVIAETGRLPSEGDAKRQLVPFYRAINYALGFDAVDLEGGGSPEGAVRRTLRTTKANIVKMRGLALVLWSAFGLFLVVAATQFLTFGETDAVLSGALLLIFGLFLLLPLGLKVVALGRREGAKSTGNSTPPSGLPKASQQETQPE